jgi:hypothetical protein
MQGRALLTTRTRRNMKHRPDPLSLFYFRSREEAELAFNGLVAVDDAIQAAKTLKDARKRLSALQQGPQPKQIKEFITRLLPLHKDRMERTAQTAIRRVFTSTHHYQSALIHRTAKARPKGDA